MSNDKSEGFYRRMVIIPMLRKFGKDGQRKDPMLLNKLITPHNMSALLNLALKGLKRTLKITRLSNRKLLERLKKNINLIIIQFCSS